MGNMPKLELLKAPCNLALDELAVCRSILESAVCQLRLTYPDIQLSQDRSDDGAAYWCVWTDGSTLRSAQCCYTIDPADGAWVVTDVERLKSVGQGADLDAAAAILVSVALGYGQS